MVMGLTFSFLRPIGEGLLPFALNKGKYGSNAFAQRGEV